MHPVIRVLWFIFIGWWLGIIWFLLSMALMLSIVFFPIGAYAATKTWHVMVLKESPKTVVVEAQSQTE